MTLLKTIVRTTTFESEFTRRVEAKLRKVLFRTGSFGRTFLRRNFKRRKRVSPRNAFPYAHVSGNQGIKDTRFRVNLDKGSVAMGIELNSHRQKKKVRRNVTREIVPLVAGDTMQLLNVGGPAVVRLSGAISITTRLLYHKRPFQKLALVGIEKNFQSNLESIPF